MTKVATHKAISLLCILLITIWGVMYFSAELDHSSIDTPYTLPSTIATLEQSIFSICLLNQQYVRDTEELAKQTCIPKGQAVAIERNYLLTAKHVVEDLERSYAAFPINTDKTLSRIQTIRHHPDYDLALIAWQGVEELIPVTIATGFLTQETPVTIVVDKNSIHGKIIATTKDTYSTNFSLEPSDSGSPLFSTVNKKLVGINTATSTDIPTSYAVIITESLLKSWFDTIDLNFSQ